MYNVAYDTSTCGQAESCFSPVEHPGLAWVEITYSRPSSPECQNHQKSILPDNTNPNIRERRCLQSLVFIGEVISMAHSVHLTSYQPRWSIDFAADLPNLIEKLLTCAFHVSMILALLNSLPVCCPPLHVLLYLFIFFIITYYIVHICHSTCGLCLCQTIENKFS